MRRILYIRLTWLFCHFGREINKMFKNEECSGSIICQAQLATSHCGVFSACLSSVSSQQTQTQWPGVTRQVITLGLQAMCS